MKVAVWSPGVFGGRKSSNLLLFAMQAIAESGEEQLVLHADAAGSGPEHFLLAGRQRLRMMKQKEFGVELLCKMMHCEPFTKEMAVNASYSFAEKKLHILPPGNGSFYEEQETAAKEISRVMKCAGEVFQHVWIELPAGESEFSNAVLSEADCVIVNLTQSPYETAKLDVLPAFDKAFYLVGAYEQRNVFTVHNLGLLYSFLRGRSAMIPYERSFAAACCSGEAEQFLLRGMDTEAEEGLSSFFRTVKRAYRKWERGDSTKDAEKNGEESEKEKTRV